MKCPNCGCTVSDTRQICPFCGLILPIRQTANEQRRTQSVYADGVRLEPGVRRQVCGRIDGADAQRMAIILLLAGILLVEVLCFVVMMLLLS